MNPKDRGQRVLGGQVPLRFVQIMAASTGNAEDFTPLLYGLDAEGQVWEYMWGKERLKESVKRKNAFGIEYTDSFGPPYSWWQPLRMSREKGSDHEHPVTPKEYCS